MTAIRLRQVAAGALAISVLTVSSISARPAASEGSRRCRVTQMTHNSNRHRYGPRGAAVAGNGYRLVFTDDTNFGGRNPDHEPWLYLYDVAGGVVTPVDGLEGQLGDDPVLSEDGSVLVYRTGGVYAYDVASAESVVVSDPPTLMLDSSPAISADASVIAWVRDSTASGFGPYQVMVLDRSSGDPPVVIPVDDTRSLEPGVFGPDVSPDGSLVTFLSTEDLADANPEGLAQLFVYDRSTGTTVQATPNRPGSSLWLVGFVDGGSKVVFKSDREYTGPNPSRRSHLYVYDVATGVISRMSDLGAEGTMSRDGSRIAHVDDANVDGANTDGSDEVFSFDVATGATTQLTSQASGPDDTIYGISHSSSDGSVIAFLADGDLTGENPNHHTQLFVATTCGPPPRPDAAIAAGGTGPYAGADVYSAVPDPAQKAVATLALSETRTFFVQIGNDRAVADSFGVRGVGSGSPGYVIRFRDGRTDITDSVRAGSYRVGPLAPGETHTIKVKVTAVAAAPGSGRTVDVRVQSRANPATPDTVRARVTRS